MEINNIIEVESVKSLTIGEKLKYFFTNPNKLFEDYKTKPTWKLKLLIIIAIVLVHSIFTKLLTFGLQIDLAMQQMQDLSKEQAQAMLQFFNSSWMTVIFAIVFVLSAVAVVFFVPLIYYGLISLFDGKTTYRSILSVYSLAYIPFYIGSLVNLAIAYFANNYESILNPDVVDILLSRLDLFVIWQVLLLIFGFSKVANIKLWKSGIIVGIMWLITTGIEIMPRLL